MFYYPAEPAAKRLIIFLFHVIVYGPAAGV